MAKQLTAPSAAPATVFSQFRAGRNDVLLDRWEQRTNLPMLILAAAMLPLLVVPLVTPLEDSIESLFVYGEWAIWAVFAIDLLGRLWLAENRLSFLRHNWIDVLIVIVPYIRPLRLLRVVPVLAKLWDLLDRRGVHATLVLALIMIVGATVAIWGVEEGAGGDVHSWDTALWWTLHTMATGDGVNTASSVLGRIVGAIVTLLGFALLGMVTATIAAWFVEQEQDEDQRETLQELALLRQEVRALREALETQSSRED